MNTKKYKITLQNKIINYYYEKTGLYKNSTSLTEIDLLNTLKEDIENYLIDTLNIQANKLILTYFFDHTDIKELINLYFKTNKIDINDIKKLQSCNNKFTNKYINIMPSFADNIFYSIAKELSYYISKFIC